VPGQIETLLPTEIVGSGFTLTTTVSVLLQPLALVPVRM
jgi:hypothetical protein